MSTRRILLCICAVASGGYTASAAVASCMPTTPMQQRARANVIFEGVALQGPNSTGVQSFRVTRYLTGRGPDTVRVDTGYIRRANGSGTITSVSLIVRRGESWRIFGRGSVQGVVQTNQCDGSAKR